MMGYILMRITSSQEGLVTVTGNGIIIVNCNIQGGSDKSGILKIFLENHTAQLKIIRFY